MRMVHRTQESAVFGGCTLIVKDTFRAWFRRVSNTERPCPLPVRSGHVTFTTRRLHWALASGTFMGFLWHWHDWVNHCTRDRTHGKSSSFPPHGWSFSTPPPSWGSLMGRGTSYLSSITKALLSFRQFWGWWSWVCQTLGARPLRSSGSWWWTG